MADAALSPRRLLNLGYAFTASRTLLTAVELDLFSVLTEPKTAEEIRVALNLHPRGFPDFPDALVALGVLERDGDGPDCKYANTPESATFLVQSSPRYNGSMLLQAAQSQYSFWGHLTEGLRTGEVQSEANKRNSTGGKCTFWDSIYASPARLEAFLATMTENNTDAHRAFARVFDFSNVATLLDVGGASAQLSVEVASINTNVTCLSLDLPPVTELAKDNVRRQRMQSRVIPVEGDMLAEAAIFPKVDVIVMAMVLHNYGVEQKLALMRKAYAALKDGGRFVAIEMLIDDERRKSVPALMMSLAMMINTEGGFDYSAKQFGEWAAEVGFAKSHRLDLLDPIHAVVAYK